MSHTYTNYLPKKVLVIFILFSIVILTGCTGASNKDTQSQDPLTNFQMDQQKFTQSQSQNPVQVAFQDIKLTTYDKYNKNPTETHVYLDVALDSNNDYIYIKKHYYHDMQYSNTTILEKKDDVLYLSNIYKKEVHTETVDTMAEAQTDLKDLGLEVLEYTLPQNLKINQIRDNEFEFSTKAYQMFDSTYIENILGGGDLKSYYSMSVDNTITFNSLFTKYTLTQEFDPVEIDNSGYHVYINIETQVENRFYVEHESAIDQPDYYYDIPRSKDEMSLPRNAGEDVKAILKHDGGNFLEYYLEPGKYKYSDSNEQDILFISLHDINGHQIFFENSHTFTITEAGLYYFYINAIIDCPMDFEVDDLD